MDTLKTAVVVVLLLAVLYGVYVVLNKPGPLPHDLAWPEQLHDPALQIELGAPQPAQDFRSPALDGMSVAGSPPAGWDGSQSRSVNVTGGETSPATPARPSLTPPELLLSASGETPVEEATLAEPSATKATPSLAAETATPALRTDVDLAAATAATHRHAAVQSASAAEQIPTRSGSEHRDNRYSSGPANSFNAADVSSSSPAAPSENTTALAATDSLPSVITAAHEQMAEGKWYEALLKLSHQLETRDLNPSERQQLLDLLDPLAGKVIYSREHLMEAAYSSQRGDSLFQLADRYQVPWELLANINGIENPEVLLAGTELKVLRGPFRAEISISQGELTLFVGKLYAGRFPITVGNDPLPKPGNYEVKDKQPGRTYYAGDGQTIASEDPNNPYGRVWIDLGGDLCIHGSSENGLTNGSGCISLSPVDAADVYGILSKGSKVTIIQ